MDYCSKVFNQGEDSDTVASYNDNQCRDSESLDDWTTFNATVTTNAAATPDGIDQAWEVQDDGTHATAYLTRALGSIFPSGGTYSVTCVRVKEADAVDFELGIYDQTGTAWRSLTEFTWVAGSLTVSSDVVGTGAVTDLGGGWWLATSYSASGTIVANNLHIVYIYTTRTGAMPGGAVSHIMTGVTVYASATQVDTQEYQKTEDRDGTSTNITLTTGGLTLDEYIGGKAMINEGDTHYVIVDNGTGYVRVTGDASGDGLNAIELSDSANSGCLIGSEDPCFNTWASCENTDYYDKTTKTYRWCEPRLSSKEQVSIDARPQIKSVQERPPSKPIDEGIGTRASAMVEFQDEAHHDRGVDPYVADRAYTPEDQGTWWGKWRARNPYYNGRPFRIMRGWAEADGIDLVNDFITKHYLLEGITGPDRRGRTTVTMKDPLKLADDERALCPARSTGVLDANITAVAAAATLSPTGIGDSEYPASGTLRIGAECTTFTRVADALTLTNRGTDGTTASTHNADDAVQLCYVVTSENVDDVIYELLVTYAGIDATYITAADWADEVDDWMSGHTLTGIVTEPTGVAKLINEICSVVHSPRFLLVAG
jgi:hypothetical protein